MECTACGRKIERPNLLECQVCGHDQREPVDPRPLMDLGDDDENPEENWTPEQWRAWEKGERDWRREQRGQRRDEDE